MKILKLESRMSATGYRPQASRSRAPTKSRIRWRMYSSPSLNRCARKARRRKNRSQNSGAGMKRILAQVKKELTQLFRDKMTLALALVLPVLLLLLLSKATSLTVKDIPVAVQDLDKTPSSRQYIEAVGGSLSFKVTALPLNISPERALDQNLARAALIIPPHFERNLKRGQNAELQWLVDGTDANTA